MNTKMDTKRIDITELKKLWTDKNRIEKGSNIPFRQKIVDELAYSFAIGDFYYYVVDFSTLQMLYVSESVKQVLGVEAPYFTVDKILDIMHPEDVRMMRVKEEAAMNFLFNKIKPEDIPEYKVIYMMRILDKNGNYKKILHQARAIRMSDNNKIEWVLGIHSDISGLGIPFDHKISLLSHSRPSFIAMDPNELTYEDHSIPQLFTKQEQKIIFLLAEGKKPGEIAVLLHLSEHTVKTHRKNILQKSGRKNTPELIAFCIREGII